jgi:hypothetical protein
MPVVPGLPVILPQFASINGSYQTLAKETSSPQNWIRDYKIGGTYIEVPLSVTFTFNTNATVGNRFPRLVFMDQDANWIVQVISGAQAASTNAVYTFSALMSVSLGAGGTNVLLPFPPTLMLAGYTCEIFVVGFQVGDVLGSLTIQTMRFPTNEPHEGVIIEREQPAFADLSGFEVPIGGPPPGEGPALEPEPGPVFTPAPVEEPIGPTEPTQPSQPPARPAAIPALVGATSPAPAAPPAAPVPVVVRPGSPGSSDR